MSYCTIEEAWGLGESFVDEHPPHHQPPPTKSSSSKRRSKRRHGNGGGSGNSNSSRRSLSAEEFESDAHSSRSHIQAVHVPGTHGNSSSSSSNRSSNRSGAVADADVGAAVSADAGSDADTRFSPTRNNGPPTTASSEAHQQQPDDIEEPFVNSPAAFYNMPTFARSVEPGREPEAAEIVLDGPIAAAPFSSSGTDMPPTTQAGGSVYENAAPVPRHRHHSRTSATNSNQMTLYSHASPSPDSRDLATRTHTAAGAPTTVHEELEWMRNNMSHLSDKLDKLTDSLDTRTRHHQQDRSSSLSHDTLVFVFVGLFVLLLIDVFFRAGQRWVVRSS